MKDLLVFILKSIVDEADKVEVDEREDDTGQVNLTVRVAESDMGKVIGKGGKVINAIRQVVKIAAIKNGKRLNINLEDPKETQEEKGEKKTGEVKNKEKKTEAVKA